MIPYFDKSTNESQQPEISLHGLNVATAQALFEGLDALVAAEAREMKIHKQDYIQSKLLSQKENAERCTSNINNLNAFIIILKSSFADLKIKTQRPRAIPPIPTKAHATPPAAEPPDIYSN